MKTLGITPGVYLHRHRLNQAHRDLVFADPHATTVTAIAQKWGFMHPGRFSAEHRRLFAEMPSEALRKDRHSPASRLLDAFPGT